MKYDKNLNGIKTTKTVKRRVEPEYLKVPDFVQTPPSKRPVNQQRQVKMQQNTRRHKRRHKKNYILYYISLLFLITVIGVSLSLTVFFNIESIAVKGNTGIDTNSIIASCGIAKGQNLFRINIDKASKSIISKHLTIDNVIIKRKIPNTLSIEVKMAKTKAEISYSGKSYNLSFSNKIIGVGKAPADATTIKVVGSDLKDIKIGQYIIPDDKNKLEVIDIVLAAIEKKELSQIKVIDITDEMIIKLYYGDRYEIKVGGVLDIEYKLQWAINLIDQQLTDENEKGIIDVSVNNGMYYFRHADKINIP
ncbi:MAG: FtsQ-type POTRA domain-containing protein [Oscillospiraceae bacterium]